MKFEKAKQLKTIGTAVSLALLLGVGSVNANPPAHSNSPKNNSDDPNVDPEYGASVGVSSTCALIDDGKTFQVTTTITDKSSGDTIPSYGPGMSYVDYIGKKSGRKTADNPYVISSWNKFNPNEAPEGDAIAGVVTNTLDLCTAGLMEGTVSLNSLTSVYVSNSKDGTSYTAQCSDDPYTSENEGKVVIDFLDCQ